MTQNTTNDLVFYDNNKEVARIDGNKPWKQTETPSHKLEIKNVYEPNTITLNTSATNEIAKFTNDGFYYKDEFIEDAGEVYRLLKEVLGMMKAEQNL